MKRVFAKMLVVASLVSLGLGLSSCVVYEPGYYRQPMYGYYAPPPHYDYGPPRYNSFGPGGGWHHGGWR